MFDVFVRWKFTPQLAELNAVDNSEKITKTRKIAQLYKEKPRFTSPRLSGTSNLLYYVELSLVRYYTY